MTEDHGIEDISTEISHRAKSALAELALEMVVDRRPQGYRILMWQAVAEEAFRRANAP